MMRVGQQAGLVSESDPFFLVTPERVDRSRSSVDLDGPVPMSAFPAAFQAPIFPKGTSQMCTMSQRHVAEEITGLAETLGYESRSAKWLLGDFHSREMGPSCRLTKSQIEQSFVVQFKSCNAIHSGASNSQDITCGRSADDSKINFEENVLFVENEVLDSFVLGTMCKSNPDDSSGLGMQFFRVLFHLPTGSMYIATQQNNSQLVLDRLVVGPGMQSTFESIFISPDGAVEYVTFGETVCQFCLSFFLISKPTSLICGALAYAGCACPKSMQERAMGPRILKPFESWNDIRERYKPRRYYTAGVFAPGQQSSYSRPWMHSTEVMTTMTCASNPIVHSARLFLVNLVSMGAVELWPSLNMKYIEQEETRKCEPTNQTAANLFKFSNPGGPVTMPQTPDTKPRSIAYPEVTALVEQQKQYEGEVRIEQGPTIENEENFIEKPSSIEPKPRRDSASVSKRKRANGGQRRGEKRGENQCPHCSSTFASAYNTKRHIQATHRGSRIGCLFCPSTFSQTSNLARHVQKAHSQMAFNVTDLHGRPEDTHACDVCQAIFSSRSNLARHSTAAHRNSNLF